MDDQIPFTTGGLKDWPIVEEAIDEILAKAAEQIDAVTIDADFKQEVLDEIRGFYEAVNGTFDVPLSLPPLPIPMQLGRELEDRIRGSIREVESWFRERLMAGMIERIGAAAETVRLRRRLRELGEDY